MKKNLFLTVAIVALFSFLTTNVHAQENKFSVGGGFTYATEIDEAGIFAKGIYHFTPKWEASLTGTYYFVDGVTFLGFDPDVHYVFYNNEKNIACYGLAGLNIITLKAGDFSANELGINLGVGLRYKFTNNLSLNPSFKYVIATEDGSDGYFGLNIGLMYSF